MFKLFKAKGVQRKITFDTGFAHIQCVRKLLIGNALLAKTLLKGVVNVINLAHGINI